MLDVVSKMVTIVKQISVLVISCSYPFLCVYNKSSYNLFI
jgi:hypothetical protein